MSLGDGQTLSNAFMEGSFLVSVDATREVGRSTPVFSRLASWAEAATVTDPQWRLAGPGNASVNPSEDFVGAGALQHARHFSTGAPKGARVRSFSANAAVNGPAERLNH